MCSVDREWKNGTLNRNCNGRLVSTGTSIVPITLAVVLQLIGYALFFAFPARYLYDFKNNSAPIVLGVFLSALSIVCFSCTALIDPGVLPPAEVPIYLQHQTRPPRTQHIITSQGRCTLRFCDECSIFRPLRAEHCPECRNCIAKYDHHCPWVGNCVGERNYRFFYGFLLSICTFTLLSIACCISELVLRNASDFDPQSGGSLALLIYSVLCGSFVFALCGLHTYLLAVDKTTYELFRKFAKAEQKKPGIRTAFISFVNLCGPTTPSLVREKYRSSKTQSAISNVVAKEVSPNDFRCMLTPGIVAARAAENDKTKSSDEAAHIPVDDQTEFEDDEDEAGIALTDLRVQLSSAIAEDNKHQSEAVFLHGDSSDATPIPPNEVKETLDVKDQSAKVTKEVAEIDSNQQQLDIV